MNPNKLSPAARDELSTNLIQLWGEKEYQASPSYWKRGKSGRSRGMRGLGWHNKINPRSWASSARPAPGPVR